MNRVTWNTILGRNPRTQGGGRPIVVALQFPKMGEHDFKWKVAEALGLAYHHYGYRLHPKSMPVNMQVYGDRKVVQHISAARLQAVCELELVVKRTEAGKEYILVNLFLIDPKRHVSHELRIVGAKEDRPWFVYTTKDMNGVGISVMPL